MTFPLMQTTNNEYIKRINRVVDLLTANYHQPHDLESLSNIAGFSKYHFHRIFKAITGETLNQYQQRIKIEKAAHALKYQRNKSITEIALDCGFINSSSFSRAFKEHFAISATEWRDHGHIAFSNNRKVQSNYGKTLSKPWQAEEVSLVYIDNDNNHLVWNINMLNHKNVQVEVKNLPETTIAYIRHIGPFVGETATWSKLFQKLITWGSAHNLIACPGTEYFTVFRDELEITDLSKFKADVCISVPEDTKANGEIGISTIAAGKYAIAQFEIDADQYEQAWQLVYGVWLPESGFQPDDRCCFERYLNDPKMHPQNKHLIEVCIPVKPI